MESALTHTQTHLYMSTGDSPDYIKVIIQCAGSICDKYPVDMKVTHTRRHFLTYSNPWSNFVSTRVMPKQA